MNKEEAREFLEKYITVVGGMKAIDDLAKTGDESAKAFLKKYMNVVYAGKAIAILAGATGVQGATGPQGAIGA